MLKLFGTDGIRGKVNSFPMDSHTISTIGYAIGVVARKFFIKSEIRVLIGRDTRASCDMVEDSLIAGLVYAGVNVELIGVIPTPGVALLTKLMAATIGIMVSASHNSYEDNGIKLFSGDGTKLSVNLECEIERIVELNLCSISIPSISGNIPFIGCAEDRYVDFLLRTFSPDLTLENMTIVLDAANGAVYKVVGRVFTILGANVITIGNNPNGVNINHNCGAMYPEVLSEVVADQCADIGFAFDGDGDRVLICDNKGSVKSGDQILASIAKHRKDHNRLNKNLVIGTVMSGICFERYLNSIGIDLIRTSVGDRYVSESMREHGSSLGGEASGHIIMGEYSLTGDGILTAIQLCSIIREHSAGSICDNFVPFPRVMINIACDHNNRESSYYRLLDLAREIEVKFRDIQGRILVRKSGTEDVIRVMIESEDSDLLHSTVNVFNSVMSA